MSYLVLMPSNYPGYCNYNSSARQRALRKYHLKQGLWIGNYIRQAIDDSVEEVILKEIYPDLKP